MVGLYSSDLIALLPIFIIYRYHKRKRARNMRSGIMSTCSDIHDEPMPVHQR